MVKLWYQLFNPGYEIGFNLAESDFWVRCLPARTERVTNLGGLVAQWWQAGFLPAKAPSSGREERRSKLISIWREEKAIFSKMQDFLPGNLAHRGQPGGGFSSCERGHETLKVALAQEFRCHFKKATKQSNFLGGQKSGQLPFPARFWMI